MSQRPVSEQPRGIVGYKPLPEAWTVRRCPIHELVVTDEDYCPHRIELDETCGLALSAPFEVQEVPLVGKEAR